MKTRLTLLALGTAWGLLSASAAITAADASSILFMKQEEKLARDVYQTLAARWNHPALANIATSEQQHMTAVDGLVRRFRLPDPTPTTPGQFSIPELQDLHDDLVARGSQSLAEALAVGILIEEEDIADLDALLATTQDRNVRQVMSNLRQGSLRHLAAFESALAGVTVAGSATPADPACTGTGAGPVGGNRTRGRR